MRNGPAAGGNEPWTFNPLSALSDLFDNSGGGRKLEVEIYIPPVNTKREFVFSVEDTFHALEIQNSRPKVMTDVNSILKFRLEGTERNKKFNLTIY